MFHRGSFLKIKWRRKSGDGEKRIAYFPSGRVISLPLLVAVRVSIRKSCNKWKRNTSLWGRVRKWVAYALDPGYGVWVTVNCCKLGASLHVWGRGAAMVKHSIQGL